nr:LysR family transcriptional regulator [uncultured Enterobacter sp.]
MATLNLVNLATFRLVVSRQSFSAAAQVLGLSQPAVSLQVRQLEQALQTQLVERTSRGIRPTPAGLTLLEHSDHIDKAVSDALQSVALHSQEISGTVTLGSGATACIHLMPRVLEQLRADFPLLRVSVRTGNTRDIVAAVEENRLDMGLVTLPASGRNLHIAPLIADDFVAITEDKGENSDGPCTPAQLNALPLIVFEGGSNTRALIDEWFFAAGETAHPIMELGSIEAIKRMVRAGLGYSIVPRLSVTDAADRDGLRLYPLQPALTRSLGTVTRQDKIMTRAMTEIVNRIRALSL